MIALLNQKARDEIQRVVRQVEKIETAVEPRFQAHFVEAMGLPHTTADYPNLSKVIDLPPRGAPVGASGEDGGTRRRRRRSSAPA